MSEIAALIRKMSALEIYTFSNKTADRSTRKIGYKCDHSLSHAKASWEHQGLFIPIDAITHESKPYLQAYVQMGCGTILTVILPTVENINKRPKTFPEVVWTGSFLGQGQGIYIAFEEWKELGSINDYVLKSGSKKRPYLAEKTETQI